MAWCENYWYHYKYHTLVSLVLVVALVVCIAQCSSRKDYDYQVVLAVGSVEMVPSQVEALAEQLEAIGTDQNGDGEVTVSLIDCSYNGINGNYSVVTSKRQKLQAIFMNKRDTLLFICDKACYDWLDTSREAGFMEDLGLSEEDGRYFSLTDSKLYKSAKEQVHSDLKWPEELRISRRIVSGTLIEKDKNVEKYIEISDKLLADIIKQNS